MLIVEYGLTLVIDFCMYTLRVDFVFVYFDHAFLEDMGIKLKERIIGFYSS